MDKFSVAFSHIETEKILFLKDTEKKPKKRADIRKIGYPMNFITENKFIMIIYEQVNVGITEAQKIMLVYHELLHIDSSFERLLQHDCQDFIIIVAKYGTHWDVDANLPNLLEDEVDFPQSTIDLDDFEDFDEPELKI